MTAKIDFIGNIHGDWLEKNIRKDFGPSPDTAKLFIARVLEVVESEGPPDPRSISANDFNMYHIRCRILTLANHGNTNFESESKDTKENPDALLPDPCNWTEPTANAHIQRHPMYYPNDNKLKKPHPGDLVKVTRNITEDPILGVAGHYVGFLTQTPPMELPKDPPSRNGWGLGNLRPRKTTPPGSTPPRRYKGEKLAEIARQAANAINNAQRTGTVTNEEVNLVWQDRQKSGFSTARGDVEGLERGGPNPRGSRKRGTLSGLNTSDERLVQVAKNGMVATKKLAGGFTFTAGDADPSTIPDSWYDAKHEDFQLIEQFILMVSDGYPGMPNTPTRKYLLKNVKKLTKGPPPSQFATNSDYWKIWWFGGTRLREAAPLNGKYRSIITKTNYIPKTKNQIRFGFGSFTIEDILFYFPMSKDKKYGIKYTGTNGIGDPVCEMYAFMMFIRMNFGTPFQFASMNDEARKIASNSEKQLKCTATQIDNHLYKIHSTNVGNYEIDHTIMPKNSPFSYGMCDTYPISKDV